MEMSMDNYIYLDTMTEDQKQFSREGDRLWSAHQKGKLSDTEYAKGIAKLGEQRLEGKVPETTYAPLYTILAKDNG